MNNKYIRYYAIALLLVSLLGTEIYYVPLGDFKVSVYRFFLCFFPLFCCFISLKELKHNCSYFIFYWLIAWLPHTFFSVYWSKDFAFTDNLIFFIGATITAVLLTGSSVATSPKQNFLQAFYPVETGICVLGLVCCVQYLFNFIGMPFFYASLLDQNISEIILFGQESFSMSQWWDPNANVFIFSSFAIALTGYFLDRKKVHIVLSIFFVFVYILAG
ncbi:MAG: hypothetical protein LBQ31_06835 [Bacteroidales bacterium]|jgi:hypothetical protein|nr:hypothetical protein [Bacteroidales bacterium]